MYMDLANFSNFIYIKYSFDKTYDVLMFTVTEF